MSRKKPLEVEGSIEKLNKVNDCEDDSCDSSEDEEETESLGDDSDEDKDYIPPNGNAPESSDSSENEEDCVTDEAENSNNIENTPMPLTTDDAPLQWKHVNESPMSSGNEMTNALNVSNYAKSQNDEDSLNLASHKELCTPINETEYMNNQENKHLTDAESRELTQDLDLWGPDLEGILESKLPQISSETFETKFDTVNTNLCDDRENVFASATRDILKETKMKANLERRDKDLNPVINENPLPEPHDHHTFLGPQSHNLNAASLSVHEPHNLHTSSVPEPRNHHASSVSEQGNIVHHHASSVSEQGNIVQIASPKDNDLVSKTFESATSAKPVWIIIPAKIIGQSPNSLANSDDAIKDSIPASPPKTMRLRRASKRPLRFDDFQSSASGEEEDQRRSSAEEEGQRRSSEQLSEAEKFRRMRRINNISSKKCRYKKKMRLRALEDDIPNEKAEHVKLLNMLEQWELKKQKWKELVMSISAKKN